MDSRGCGFGFTVMAILFVMIFMSGAILASIGIAPVANSVGLSWDNSAYLAREANRTQRYIVEQQQQTERDRQGNETLRLFAIVGGVAGVLGLGIVQYNRTRRHSVQVDAMVQLHVAQNYRNARIEQRNGAKVLVDYDRQEIVPYNVITQEIDADWRQLQ